MSTSNGILDEQFEALRSTVRKLIDRGEPPKLRTFATKARELIAEHPIAAVGIAFGVGYAIVRIARR